MSGVPSIRPLATTDSLADLTDLLHRAYASLAAMGMRFFGSYQTVEQTRSRVESGECFVLELDGSVVGTVTLYRDFGHEEPAWYCRPDVAYFGQFAVEPSHQGRGFGNLLMSHVETIAAANGRSELALDTAEAAQHLIDYYERHGYRFIQYTQWRGANYRSVVMSKRLEPARGR